MKYIKHLMLSALVLASFTSCNDDDTDYIFTPKAQVTIDNVSESAITEGESVMVTLTVDNPFKETLDFKLEMISGGDNADYNTGDPSEPNAATTPDDGFGNQGYLVQIPAYASSYTFQINSILDLDVEGTEKYTFKLVNTRNGQGLINGNNKISFDVANYEDDNMGIRLSWSKDESYQILKENVLEAIDNETGLPYTYTEDDETLTEHQDLCGAVDYDVFVTGSAVSAFTGDCPEYIISGGANPTQVLADGQYLVVVDLWDFDLGLADDESLIGSFAIPFDIVIAKTGKFKTTLSYPSLYFSYSDTSASGADGTQVVAVVDVVGGKYTVRNNLGEVVAQE